MSASEQLKSIVGADHVITDPAVLSSYRSDEGHEPQCVVRPGGLEEIQKIISLANRESMALTPRSSTGLRLRGDTTPGKPGAVIVDLSRMDAIVRVDRRNKVAMIEPGVTFPQLIQAADQEDLRLEMPMLPRRDKSVVASLLEREPTTGPKYNWDANDPLCCIEVVFGTGDRFRTGNAAGPGTLEEQWASGQAQKIPMGPAQTDLARLVQGAQGSLGIVSWATIKLERKPVLVKGFVVRGQGLADLVDFTYHLLWRKLPDLCLILNDADLAAATGIDRAKLAPWNLVYSISGLKHFPEERLRYLEQDIADLAREFKVTPSRSLAGMSTDDLVNTLAGPSPEPYWKQGPRGAFQDLFFLTTLDRAQPFIDTVTKAAGNQGFTDGGLGIYLQPVRHGSACHLEFSLFFDPGNREQADRARAVMDEAARACVLGGAFFSRPYGSWADLAYERCPDTVTALRKLKGIFDPAGVMNPGRLCFGKEA